MTDSEVWRAILDELRTMNANQRTKRQPLDHREHRLVGALFPAIAGARGSSAWTVRQLLTDPVFRDMVQMTPAEFGRLLFRVSGQDIEGLTARAAGQEHGRTLWTIVRTKQV